jgi:murein tripeptide amidase MpaA
MHAREWISPPTVTWSIKKLLEDVTEPDLLDKFDWILMPVANPDGYEFSHTNVSMRIVIGKIHFLILAASTK